jgi:hypothetical protein
VIIQRDNSEFAPKRGLIKILNILLCRARRPEHEYNISFLNFRCLGVNIRS